MAPRGGKKIVIVRKKVAAPAAHHGGSWKVAYADFVTAMMAFFMVMWILGMDDKTRKAIEGYFSNPVGYRKGYGAGASPVSRGTAPTNVQRTPLKLLVRSTEQKSFEQLRQTILQRVAQNDSLKKLNALVEVQVTKDGLRIELIEQGAGDIYFPTGSARLKPASLLALQLVGTELASLSHSIVIEGHTDAARFGNDASYGNWELSSDRANAARRVLETAGIKGGRIREVRGYSDTKLRVPDNPVAPANRRISILLPYSDVPDAVSATADELVSTKRDSLVESIRRTSRD